MPTRFRRTAANGLSAEWELTVGDDVYAIRVSRRACTVREGPASAPATRLTADADTWIAIDDGSLWGMEAFLERRVAIRGNLDLAVRLQTLFEPRTKRHRRLDLEQIEVESDDMRLSSYVTGSTGPAIVMLHGLGGTKVSMLPLVPDLAPRYRIIVPDLPGHGESEKVPRTDYTPRFYARHIRRLMDVLDVPDAVVVGNSLGGRIALELAVRSPDRVTGLVLLAAAVPGFRARYVLGFTRVIPSEWGGLPFPSRERWMQMAIRRLFADPTQLPEDGFAAAADEFIRVYQSPVARMAFFDSLRHVLMEQPRPFWARMAKVRVPALVVWGEEDRLVPIRLGLKLAEVLPRSELLVLPGVGHVPQFEAQAETQRAVEAFLARQAPGAA